MASRLYTDMTYGTSWASLASTPQWLGLPPFVRVCLHRYGATLTAGIEDSPYRLLLYGGTGRYPNTVRVVCISGKAF